jgi:hypothetical protein
MSRFLGDYSNFSRVEREALKRIFPFYSWMRVVGRLTLSLPVRNPVRTEAMAVFGQAASLQENPFDALRPIWERGAIRLPGDYAIPTTSLNPFANFNDQLAAVGSGGAGGVIGSFAQQAAPPLAAFAAYATGRQPFGERDFTFAPGQGGVTQVYGQPARVLNPVTGTVETTHPRPSIWDYALGQVPFVPQIRQVASGGRTPYDTASTPDLIRYALGGGGDPSQLFLPKPKTERGSSSIPVVTPLSGLAGFPVKRYSDRGAVERAVRDARNDILGARANIRAEVKRWVQEGVPTATRDARLRPLLAQLAEKVKRFQTLEAMQSAMTRAGR